VKHVVTDVTSKIEVGDEHRYNSGRYNQDLFHDLSVALCLITGKRPVWSPVQDGRHGRFSMVPSRGIEPLSFRDTLVFRDRGIKFEMNTITIVQ
jgi:hypothetical protein